MASISDRESQERLLKCINAALQRKATNMVALNVRALSSFTDFFLICSASSDRQAKAVAGWIRETLKKSGMAPLGVEGEQHGQWVLMDYDDVVIHIFAEPMREFYDIERLWGDAPRMAIGDNVTELAGLSEALVG